MKKKIITVFVMVMCLFAVQQKTLAQYTAAKENKAMENPKAGPGKNIPTVAQLPLQCSESQKLYCDNVKNLAYTVCLPRGTDFATAKKLYGNISLTNNETDGSNYYFTLTYTWRGTSVSQQNVRVVPGTPTVINFSMIPLATYTGSITNMQVFVNGCSKGMNP